MGIHADLKMISYWSKRSRYSSQVTEPTKLEVWRCWLTSRMVMLLNCAFWFIRKLSVDFHSNPNPKMAIFLSLRSAICIQTLYDYGSISQDSL